jgi:hypothetical protein
MSLKVRLKKLEVPTQNECRFYYIHLVNENEPRPQNIPLSNSYRYDGVDYNRLAGESDCEFKARIEVEAQPFAGLNKTVVFLSNGDLS